MYSHTITSIVRLGLRTPRERVGGAGGPVARSTDEAVLRHTPRRCDAANGPPPPPTRRAGPESATGLRHSSSIAETRLISSSFLARRLFPARRARVVFSGRA